MKKTQPLPTRSKFPSGTEMMSVRGPKDPKQRAEIYKRFYKILEEYAK